MTAIVGVDIAKDQVDVGFLIDETAIQYQTVANIKRGLNKLDRWLNKQGAKGAHSYLEATGIYGDLLADMLHRRGYQISVVNPARIKAYAQSRLRRNKTDKLDAASSLISVEPRSPIS
jgi:transposase